MQMNELPSKRNSRSDIVQPFSVKNKAKSFLPRTQNSLLEPSDLRMKKIPLPCVTWLLDLHIFLVFLAVTNNENGVEMYRAKRIYITRGVLLFE